MEHPLVVLGSASQVPTRHRNHNGYFLRWGSLGFLFDPGEGTQRQMERFGVRASSITDICVTHFHGDHCLGLPGVLQRIHGDGVKHEVHVRFPATGQRWYNNLVDACAYEPRTPIVPTPVPVVGTTLTLPTGHRLTALPLRHRIDTVGWRLEGPSRWRVDPERARAVGLDGPAIGAVMRTGSVDVDGRLVTRPDIAVERPGRSFAFVMDTAPCEAIVALARDVDLLTIEATYVDADATLAEAYLHLTARQAASLAEVAGARRLLLTHFSRRYADSSVHAAEAKEVHADVWLAEDGLEVPWPDEFPTNVHV